MKTKNLLGTAAGALVFGLVMGIGLMIQHKEFPSFTWPAFSIAAGGAILSVALPAILVLILLLAGVMRGKWWK